MVIVILPAFVRGSEKHITVGEKVGKLVFMFIACSQPFGAVTNPSYFFGGLLMCRSYQWDLVKKYFLYHTCTASGKRKNAYRKSLLRKITTVRAFRRQKKIPKVF